MVIIASKIVTEAQIQKAIAKVVKKLPKHVLSVRYNLGSDWTGDPSIYFRVVLTDELFKTDGLAEETRHLGDFLSDELRIREEWSLNPYFLFSSQSDQLKSKDPAWA